MPTDPAADEAALTAATLERARWIYGEYGRGNRAAVLDVLADDVAWTSAAAPGMPWAGTWRGRAGVEAYFARLDGLLTITAYEIERFIAQGEWLAVLARGTGRFHATGEEVTIAKVDVLRLRDGVVVEFREHYDSAPLLPVVARCGGGAERPG